MRSTDEFQRSYTGLAVSRDGRRLVTIEDDIEVRDLEDLQPRFSLRSSPISQLELIKDSASTGVETGGARGSGGPRGTRNGNYKHGRYTAEAKQRREHFRQWITEQTRLVDALLERVRPEERSDVLAACETRAAFKALA